MNCPNPKCAQLLSYADFEIVLQAKVRRQKLRTTLKCKFCGEMWTVEGYA